MNSRKSGTCRRCGSKTSRTSITQCARCLKGPAPTAGTTGTSTTAEVTRLSTTPIRTLADLVRVCEIDTAEWHVERWTANKWDSLSDEGTPKFQVKATLTRKVAVVAARAEIAQMVQDARKAMPKRGRASRPNTSGHLLEIAVPDLHLGKLAWGAETGGANYDSKEAERLWRLAVSRLVERTAAFTPEHIVIPIGNDFFHSDTLTGTTTGGTALDNDSRFAKMFTAGRRLVVETVETLRQLAPVTVVMVRGNHDALSNFCLGDALECWFHRTSDVTVRNEPTPRKYMQHGNVMLLWTHGDKGKRENLPLLMATEQPAMFGATTHRECHTGHLHTTRTQEFMGVKVRVSPALCPPDAWHNENHFVGNACAAEAYVWHKTEGLVSLAVFTA